MGATCASCACVQREQPGRGTRRRQAAGAGACTHDSAGASSVRSARACRLTLFGGQGVVPGASCGTHPQHLVHRGRVQHGVQHGDCLYVVRAHAQLVCALHQLRLLLPDVASTGAWQRQRHRPATAAACCCCGCCHGSRRGRLWGSPDAVLCACDSASCCCCCEALLLLLQLQQPRLNAVGLARDAAVANEADQQLDVAGHHKQHPQQRQQPVGQPQVDNDACGCGAGVPVRVWAASGGGGGGTGAGAASDARGSKQQQQQQQQQQRVSSQVRAPHEMPQYMVGSSTSAPGKSTSARMPRSVMCASLMAMMPGPMAPSATVNAVMAAALRKAAGAVAHRESQSCVSVCAPRAVP
jgi:hypothetical protein